MVLRELLVKLGLDVDEAAFAKGELAAHLIEKGFEKLTDVVKETAEHFVEMVKETAEAGHKIEELAQQTGLSTESLQNLMTAAQFTGASSESLAQGIGVLSRNMLALKEGSEESAKLFHLLGVKAKDSTGKLRGADDVLLDLADKFQKMPDGAQKTALAMRALGRGGKELIPLLNKGRAGIEDLASNSTNLTKKQITASTELVLTQKKLAAVTHDLWQSAVAPLLPALQEIAEHFLEWRKANAAIMRQNIARVMKSVVVVVKLLGSAFLGTLKIMKSVSGWVATLVRNWVFFIPLVTAGLAAWWVSNGQLAASFVALQAVALWTAAKTAFAWAIAAAPFIAIGAAVTALLLIFDDLRVYAQGGKSLFGRFEKQINSWLEVKHNDPWWLIAIKEFVADVKEALELIVAFDDAIGLSSPEERTEKRLKRTNKNLFDEKGKYVGRQDVTFENGRQVQLRRGAVTTASGQTLRAPGSLTGAFDAPSVPGRRASSAGGGSVHVSNSIVVHANGLDKDAAEALAKRVVTEHLETQHEDTAAAFQSVP